jgi:hypothetical protein
MYHTSDWVFQPSETTGQPNSDITPHPISVAVGSGCDDADSFPYKNLGLSLKSAAEIAELPACSQTRTKTL